ncbi:MAG: hypothetical protein ABH851_04775 [Methanobacteriota archaeon]
MPVHKTRNGGDEEVVKLSGEQHLNYRILHHDAINKMETIRCGLSNTEDILRDTGSPLFPVVEGTLDGFFEVMRDAILPSRDFFPDNNPEQPVEVPGPVWGVNSRRK